MNRTAPVPEHPTAGTLALFAGKDLAWNQRLRIHRHVVRCAQCESLVKAIQSARVEMRREADTATLTSFEAIADWSRLEREMVGNIAVGVAAARCIDHVHKSRRFLVPSAVAAGLTFVFALGWMTHIPGEQTQHIFASVRAWWSGEVRPIDGTVVRSTPGGIAVRSQGTTLTMMHPRSALVSISGNSAVEARFIDENSGQVTITSVYGQ